MGKESRLVLLTGATGYVGGRLLSPLRRRGWTVRCLARRPCALRARVPQDVEVVKGDCLDRASLAVALRGVDTAFYLVHSLGAAREFEQRERDCARNFAAAAHRAGVRRIVYLGGLGTDRGSLSRHMKSRHETGRILCASGVPVIELRASIVLGAGSLSFELIRALVERLPVMLCPRWVHTTAQPIAIDDVVSYLLEAAELPANESRVFEIGGADRVSYAAIMQEYARRRGLKRVLVPLPLLTPWLSSLWLALTTPVYARVGRKLIESVRNPSAVTDDTAARTFVVRPMGMREAIDRAIRENEGGRATKLSRRALAAGVASILLAWGSVAHSAPAEKLAFRVYLEDQPIGRQVFQIRDDRDVRRISIEADFEVKAWIFTVYTYRHRNQEAWQDGCLLRIESATDDNGENLQLRGRRGPQGFTVETATASVTLDECVWTFAYWDESFLSRSNLLNSQTGEYQAVRARLIGTEPITAGGDTIAARRYLLEGRGFQIDLWYSLDRELVGLESKLGADRRLRYVRDFDTEALQP